MIEVIYRGNMINNWYDSTYSMEDDDSIEILHKILSDRRCKSILDIGCGTIRVTKELDDLGYNVADVNLRSDIVKKAREGPQIDFTISDMRSFRLKRKLDTTMIIDSCFSYMKTNNDCLSALKSINTCLKRKGVIK